MTVYVDKLQQWPSRARCFKGGSCHLIADTLAELHEFAKRLGLKREWFQGSASSPHYDLSPRRRARAVQLGAVELDRKGFVAVIRRLRSEGNVK